MRGVCRTGNLNLAAAFGSCGCEVTVDHLVDDAGGGEQLSFYLSDGPVDEAGRPVVQAVGPDGVRRLMFDTADWRTRLRNGSLEAGDPEHPLLCSLRALGAREWLLGWMKKGDRCRLVMHPRAAVMYYAAGQEPMAHCVGQPGFEVWESTDLKVVASLAGCGVPVLTMREEGPQTVFVLPRFGYPMGGPAGDAVALVKRLRDGSLRKVEPEHALVWGYQTLVNRERLLGRVKEQQRLVLLRKKNSGAWQRRCHSALVEEGARGGAFDEGLRHLRRG
jgi:hypothetical protein